MNRRLEDRKTSVEPVAVESVSRRIMLKELSLDALHESKENKSSRNR